MIYIYIYGRVVRRVRRSSFRLSPLVYRLLQFQERLFKDKETKKDKESKTKKRIILTAFLSSSTFIFFVGWSLWLPSLSFPKKKPKP